jgi:dTMP kinase
MRDRIEEADRGFFERVTKGYQVIARAEPNRVKLIDASGSMDTVAAEIWKNLAPLLPSR